MKLIVCIDDNNGMMFNNRRQSKDSVVRNRILSDAKDCHLWLNSYSAGQFENLQLPHLSISEDFLEKAEYDDFAFVENTSVKNYIDKIHELVIYRWNRKYPADFYFDIEITNDTWKQISTEEFVGSSHDKITKEVYVK